MWIELRVSAEDVKQSTLHLLLDRDDFSEGACRPMKMGTVTVQRKPFEACARPRPRSEVAKAIMEELLKNPDEEDRGVSFLVRGIPAQPTLAAFICSIKGRGDVKGGKKREFAEGVNELVTLGWLREAAETEGRIIYEYVPDPIEKLKD